MSHLVNPFSLSACALAASLMISGCGGGSATTDTTPPTVAITDNVSIATATGAVTFTFTFSEDVGTSFVVEDVTVTGGSAGTLTKVDATHYTLVVTPAANTTGNLSVGVGVAKFKDIALNDNTVGATATQAFSTVVAPTTTTLATFDEATPPGFVGFDGAEGTAIAAGPSGGTGNALKILRTGGQVWAGAKVTGLTLSVSTSNNMFSARVHSPAAGKRVVLKLEGNGATSEIDARETVVAGWQTLTWVIPSGDIGPVRSDVVFLPDLGTTGTGEAYYFDEVKLGPVTTTAPPPAPVDSLLATFDESTPPGFVGFDGADGSSIAAGPSGGSGNALKILRTGGQVWAGAKITGRTLNVSATANTVSARVHSPAAGKRIVLKLEGNGATGDIDAREAVVAGWQTLTWVIPAGDIGPVRSDVVFLPDLGTLGTGEIFYFDDVKLLGGGAVAVPTGCTPTTPAASPNLVTFDGDCSTLVGFEGTSLAAVVADPAGGANMVGKVVKPAGGAAAFYAGVTVSNGANFSIPAIPFTATSAKVSMRVYSAYAGMRVHLKLEKADDPGTNVQHDAFTTLANQWETLTFNLVETATHFNPSGPTTYNAAQPTANFVLGATYNKANVFFDYGLGSAASGGYAVMPAERTYYFDDLKFVP